MDNGERLFTLGQPQFNSFSAYAESLAAKLVFDASAARIRRRFLLVVKLQMWNNRGTRNKLEAWVPGGTEKDERPLFHIGCTLPCDRPECYRPRDSFRGRAGDEEGSETRRDGTWHRIFRVRVVVHRDAGAGRVAARQVRLTRGLRNRSVPVVFLYPAAGFRRLYLRGTGPRVFVHFAPIDGRCGGSCVSGE